MNRMENGWVGYDVNGWLGWYRLTDGQISQMNGQTDRQMD